MNELKPKIDILYASYLRDKDVKEMYALIGIISNEGFIKKSRQVEIMTNFILKTDTIVKKLMQLSIMTHTNYNVHKKLHEDLLKDG